MNSWHRRRLIVFDLDGTLIDSSRDLAKGVNTMLARLPPGAPPIELGKVRSFIGDGARKLVARSLAEAGIGTPLDQALGVFLECYRACMLETTQLYPGVTDTLEKLQDRRLAVLTNKPGEMSRAILTSLGVEDRFFRVLGGDDAPRKPEPAGLLRLVAEAGCSVAETVMVGDSANDVRTGRAADVLTVGVTYGFDPEGVRKARPDALLDDLAELLDLLGSTNGH